MAEASLLPLPDRSHRRNQSTEQAEISLLTPDY
jgi:hypothetical protein